jgi:hypothetical protein
MGVLVLAEHKERLWGLFFSQNPFVKIAHWYYINLIPMTLSFMYKAD